LEKDINLKRRRKIWRKIKSKKKKKELEKDVKLIRRKKS